MRLTCILSVLGFVGVAYGSNHHEAKRDWPAIKIPDNFKFNMTFYKDVNGALVPENGLTAFQYVDSDGNRELTVV